MNTTKPVLQVYEAASDTTDSPFNKVGAEFKIILGVFKKKWWIILATVFIVLGSTVFFTLNATPKFSAKVTYVVSPSAELLNAGSFVNGLSVLGGQPTITNTYASIATSSIVRESAIKTLGLNEQQVASLKVSSRVQTGTNLIEISVEGIDPLIVQAFANRIGRSTEEYVKTLYEVYDMKLLDGARAPEKPFWPDMRFNLVAAAIVGLVLGGGIALLASLKEL